MPWYGTWSNYSSSCSSYKNLNLLRPLPPIAWSVGGIATEMGTRFAMVRGESMVTEEKSGANRLGAEVSFIEWHLGTCWLRSDWFFSAQVAINLDFHPY
jgi:hypothetical protein